jgi:hypothetical protein
MNYTFYCIDDLCPVCHLGPIVFIKSIVSSINFKCIECSAKWNSLDDLSKPGSEQFVDEISRPATIDEINNKDLIKSLWSHSNGFIKYGSDSA